MVLRSRTIDDAVAVAAMLHAYHHVLCSGPAAALNTTGFRAPAVNNIIITARALIGMYRMVEVAPVVASTVVSYRR